MLLADVSGSMDIYSSFLIKFIYEPAKVCPGYRDLCLRHAAETDHPTF